ncbi:MAG TPA: hypothetical protein VK826_01430, partial [Bacteroidia bacterium]|nr:hypothetical protein [Bacteroidia bacterium]
MNAVITFQKTYGGPGSDCAYYVIETSDYGYAIVGAKSDTGGSMQSACLIRTNKYGDTLWTRVFDWTGSTYARSVLQTTDGGFVLACLSSNSYCTIIRTDSVGDTLWTRQYLSSIGCIRQTSDGGFIMVGTAGLMKTDASGMVEWNYMHFVNLSVTMVSVRQTADGGYVVCGSTLIGTGNWDYYLLKTDSLGTHQWSKSYGGLYDDRGMDVIQTSDGGYIMTGYSNSFSWMNYNTDMYAVRTDSAGNYIWGSMYAGSGYDYCYAVRQTVDGGFVLCGNTYNAANDACLVKINGVGSIVWSKTYGGTGSDGGFCVQVVQQDQGFILCGITAAPGQQGEFYLVKTDSLGNSYCFENNVVLTEGIRVPFVNVCNPTVASGVQTGTFPLTISSGCDVGNMCASVFQDEAELIDDGVSVFPNPVEASATITFSNPFGKPHTLIVHDERMRFS